MDEDERLEELLNEMTADELDEAFERAMEEEATLEEIMSGFPHYGYIDAEMLRSNLWRESDDYGFTVHNNYAEEIFNLPEIPPGVQVPPVIHHGERIRLDEVDWRSWERAEWFRDIYADKSEVINNFNKKCERCKKEDCVVINCFVEYVFENYELKRKN